VLFLPRRGERDAGVPPPPSVYENNGVGQTRGGPFATACVADGELGSHVSHKTRDMGHPASRGSRRSRGVDRNGFVAR